jgi:hypothetical protein
VTRPRPRFDRRLFARRTCRRSLIGWYDEDPVWWMSPKRLRQTAHHIRRRNCSNLPFLHRGPRSVASWGADRTRAVYR